jgi:hypothetical protein
MIEQRRVHFSKLLLLLLLAGPFHQRSGISFTTITLLEYFEVLKSGSTVVFECRTTSLHPPSLVST